MSRKMPAVSFRDVDIVFGKNPDAALKLLDAGKNRAEILAETGNVIGVCGASLDVGEGEICVLMGLSGSGKSTLLRAVNGLNKPVRGAVHVKDGASSVDVVSCDENTLRRLRMKQIAMVFQQFALLPWRTVAENVGFGLELGGVPEAERRARVAKQLRLVSLDQWAGKYAHELSGGMQQRVGLARAFATDAPILLMDEPFSALDPLIRTHLQDELLELQRELKRTIIFVSHDLDEALKIGTRIAIMESGQVVQYGVPQDIVLNPANEYVAQFVGHMNPLNVLTGDALMTPMDAFPKQGTALVLDPMRRLTLMLAKNGTPAKALLDGKSVKPVAVGAQGGKVAKMSMAVMPVQSPMRAIITMRQNTGLPVLLAEGARAVGVVGDAEIYAALTRKAVVRAGAA